MDDYVKVPDGWKKAAQRVRDYREAGLNKVEPPLGELPKPLPSNSQGLVAQYLTPRERELTENYDAVQLVSLMSSKKVKCEEITRAFLRRAALAQQATNCLTELLWDEAIERARYLDSLDEPAGPLHGLPISLKESLGLILGPGGKNFKTNVYYLAWADRPSGFSPTNDALWRAGAVFYARTTGPQTMMQLETNSNVYGRTVNPYNRNLTCGGSSGGEGALVGMRGSILGVGSDIGGSIRNPAACNGVYGFKPTTGRLTLDGGGVADHASTIAATSGPLATTRSDIELFMKVVLDAEPWKLAPDLIPKFWTPLELPRPARIAVIWDDGVVKPHPPITRALREVVEACRKAGMDVIDWTPWQHDRAWEIISALYFPDGGSSYIKPICDGEEPVLPLTDWITRGQPSCKVMSMYEEWEMVAARDEYRRQYARLWNATANNAADEVDAILCPVGPGAAPAHETSRYWGYTAHWNLLDYPAVSFPVTKVDAAKDLPDANYTPRNKTDAYVHSLYTGPDAFEDAPVNLQLVCRRHFDEKVLAVLGQVEKAMGRG